MDNQDPPPPMPPRMPAEPVVTTVRAAEPAAPAAVPAPVPAAPAVSAVPAGANAGAGFGHAAAPIPGANRLVGDARRGTVPVPCPPQAVGSALPSPQLVGVVTRTAFVSDDGAAAGAPPATPIQAKELVLSPEHAEAFTTFQATEGPAAMSRDAVTLSSHRHHMFPDREHGNHLVNEGMVDGKEAALHIFCLPDGLAELSDTMRNFAKDANAERAFLGWAPLSASNGTVLLRSRFACDALKLTNERLAYVVILVEWSPELVQDDEIWDEGVDPDYDSPDPLGIAPEVDVAQLRPVTQPVDEDPVDILKLL